VLTADEQERYKRHLMLPEIGEEGQERLLKSRVLIIGAGGLGAPAALYLAAAGVGTIGIADGDQVELSNLQRQIIHGYADIGYPKTASAGRRINGINPECRVIEIPLMLNHDTLQGMLGDYDFVLDATDSLAARFMINDNCVLAGVPFCHGGILGFHGQIMTVLPKATACYRCIFEDMPSEEERRACEFGGIFGALPGVAGTLQASETLKYLLGAGELLAGRLLTIDLLKMRFREITVRRNKRCKACGNQQDFS